MIGGGKKAPPRVVLDTNVVLSALVFRGAGAAKLREAWQRGACLPLVSTLTVQELIRVLAYPKFRLGADEQQDLLADYLPYTETVRVPHPAPAVPLCRDPFDLPFLHLAVAGKAHTLVTGDQDLHAISGQMRCQVLSMDAFMQLLEGAGG